MAYDANSGQLAIVHWSEAIHRFIVNGAMWPTMLKSVAISKHWPQAVAFGQTGVRGPELWSFGREDGVIIMPLSREITYRVHKSSYILNSEGNILKSRTTGTVM